MDTAPRQPTTPPASPAPRLDLRAFIHAAFEGRNTLVGGATFAPFHSAGDAELAVTAAIESYVGRPMGQQELTVLGLEVALEWNRRCARIHDDAFTSVDFAEVR